MNLLKTSALNGIAVLIRTATSFFLNKLLAIYVGPGGYALIGQFQNFIQIITSFAGGSINTAVVKYTSQYHSEPNRQRVVWRTAGTLILIFSLIVSLLIVIFQKNLSIYIFKSTEYQSIFPIFAVFLVFFNLNALFLAILNGKKEILKLVIANIAGSLLSLGLTGFLAVQYRIYGALLALSINQSIIFFVTLFLCYKSDWFKLSYLFGKIDKGTANKFIGFVLMALTSALLVPVSQILIRNHLVLEFDIKHAGYWEAMTRLSGSYLMLITTTLSVYYLPKLSELKLYTDIKKEVLLGYKLILPLTALGSLMVYLLRDWIILILFTESFIPMRDLFIWQMIGDTLKIGSWLLGYLMISKAMTKLFIFSEITATISLLLLTYVFTKRFGFEGVSMAYMTNYALYWALISYPIFKNLNKIEKQDA